MSRRRFYATRIESTQAWIEGRTARHLIDVLRAKPGQVYEIAWSGRAWLGRIATVGRDRLSFDLLEELEETTTELQLELAPAIVKFDPFEWMLEKATELGATRIHPLITRRTEPRLGEAAAKRVERWERILVDATQQSRRTAPPEMMHAVRLQEFLQQEGGRAEETGTLRFIASELGETQPLRRLLEAFATPPKRCLVLIGPEGGWTEDEAAAAQTAGFRPISLGPRILRAETASIAVLAALQMWWGEGERKRD